MEPPHGRDVIVQEIRRARVLRDTEQISLQEEGEVDVADRRIRRYIRAKERLIELSD